MDKTHRYFMTLALAEAKKAAEIGETPVGAVITLGNEIIGAGHNLVENQRDPSAHAEILALKAAREALGLKLLNGTTLYCTLEPCPMCASAAVLHRVERIVFGAPDIRWGACGTLFNIPNDERLNHRIEIIGGVMEQECAELMKNFYRQLRNTKQ